MSAVKRIVFILLSVGVYAALGILGWGGVAPFFSNPARTTLVILMFAMSCVAYFAGGNLSAGVREDRGNRWVLTAFSVLGLLAAYFPAYTDRKDFWTVDGDGIRWIGVVLAAAGGVVRIWPVFVLGDRFSGLVAIQPGHTLVTTGIYRTIRNPSYLGLLISSFGSALVFRSIVGVILTALLIPPLVARMHAEERLLHSEFGHAYDAYRAHTSRLIPGVY